MEPEHTRAELEAATALLLLSKHPIHWERSSLPFDPASVQCSQLAVAEGPPQKRVRVSNPMNLDDRLCYHRCTFSARLRFL
jgi:hypothetical protein